MNWAEDKPAITGEYLMAINVCNLKLFEIIKPHQEKFRPVFPLVEYVLERVNAVITLAESDQLWDADIIVRSAMETLVKFVLIADADEADRPQLLQEYWYDLSEIYTIKLSDQAKKNLKVSSHSELHRLAYSPQVLSAAEELRLRTKWPKAVRTKLEQKWSFGGIIGHLSAGKKGEEADGIELLTHIYRMSSHLAHGDEMGVNLIRERASRDPKEREDVSISHYLRLFSDAFSFCYLSALYTCKYLKENPEFFVKLNESLRKFDQLIGQYQMVPFEDKIYDRFRAAAEN